MTIKEMLQNIGAWPFIRVKNSKGEVIVDIEAYTETIQKQAYQEAYEECAKMFDKDAEKMEKKWQEYLATNHGGPATTFYTVYQSIAKRIRELAKELK